ncbi:glycosyl hydrolase [Pelagicoccus sp. SDUM812002]|uniref:glycoside hydrolase family 26 protein n=1 Tax=Pelagicoccus sp. SDUM812002 TaxID=3041266 RepID=UPI00280ECB95|nr:glycosyl hydrolase [Pelagicoccus sp. SDUM812002]MDQ8184152.1 glycosyl hydrolase [Pelagicoccus sp. SDUM812002]
MTLRFLYIALSLLSITATSAASEVVLTENTHWLRTELQVDETTTTQIFAVELSGELQSWTSYPLNFNSQSGTWTIHSSGAVSIFSESDNGDGSWNIVFDIMIEQTAFMRLTPLQGPFPVDSSIIQETRNLLKNIHRLGWNPEQYAFGQEFPLSYDTGGSNGDIDQSDSKDVIGDHPGVHGSDFLYMIDRPWEEDFHIAAAKRAYVNGAIVTFDYHWAGKYGGNYQSQTDDNKILDYVVRNDDSRGDVTWFYQSLDRILGIINNDLQIPIVFRPFHEMDGNWFWWGRQMQGGAETYRQAYQLLVEYLSERTDYLLFCWSPDVALSDFEQFYPGDAYVDIVGRDIYNVTDSGRPLGKLTEMIDFAEAHGKVAVLSETGYAGNGSFETNDPDWWTTHILHPIAADENAGKIAWVLTWINAPWASPYIPDLDSPQAAKDDFKTFYDSPSTLFQNEVAALDVYAAPPTD